MISAVYRLRSVVKIIHHSKLITNMLRTKTQNSRFHSLIQSLGLDQETKSDLVHQYTNGRTIKSSEMDYKEMEWLISDLSKRTKTVDRRPSTVDRSDNMRKKLISLFREMDYHTPEGKADMTRIKATLLSNWKKDLNEYTDAELSTIIAVVKRDWIPHFYKK
jgi:hypothetical protein